MNGLHRIIDPLRRRIATMINRCILSSVNPKEGLQQVQVTVLADEVMDGVEHAEPYGFTSHPLGGGEGIVLNVGGQRGACVAININNRQFRLAGLKGGEVALYTFEGDKLVFKNGNIVELTTKHFKVNAEEDVEINTKSYTVNASTRTSYQTPSYEMGSEGGGKTTAKMTADVEQDGSHTSTGDQIAGGVSQINHPHRDAGGNGNSGPPIGG